MTRPLFALLLFWCASGAQALDPMPFKDTAEEQRFQAITRELRCLVCQNQNIADSNAELAKDLRNEVFDMMRAGKSDAEINQFMTERYGDFVLYRPPMKGSTWLLWLGPFAVFIAGGVVVLRLLRRRREGAEPEPANTETAQQTSPAPTKAADPNEMIP
ncbi:MAG: cytochrome c-type biogenesis protein CcmH [Ahniella sp.]|nr:cytochrome c-type biogenesis protein CcmH [Ahniella sp.]